MGISTVRVVCRTVSRVTRIVRSVAEGGDFLREGFQNRGRDAVLKATNGGVWLVQVFRDGRGGRLNPYVSPKSKVGLCVFLFVIFLIP